MPVISREVGEYLNKYINMLILVKNPIGISGISIPKDVTKYQIGYVVKDARKTAKEYEKFGIGPFAEEIFPGIEATLYGKPVDYKILAVLANMGGWELELIQVLEGKTIFEKFLKERGEGIHHLGFYVDDLDAELAKWKKRGVRVLQWSKCPPPYPKGSGYAYLDTEKELGIVIEIAWPASISLK